MQKEEMIKKLAAVKELAEKGVGGEKETARRMYEKLKEKYGITDSEIETVKEPAEAAVRQEFSGIMFTMWVLTSNLNEEMMICRDCRQYREDGMKEMCARCATNANIKELKRQYEELAGQLERGCAG